MHIPKKGVQAVTVLAASDRLPVWPLRVIWPAHTAKFTASRFKRAGETAKKWLVEGMPTARRRAYAAVLYAELDRIEADIAQVRAFADWLEGEGGDEMACAQDRGVSGGRGAQTDEFRGGQGGR